MSDRCSLHRVHVLRAWKKCKKYIDISLPCIPLANHLTIDRQIIIHGKLCITPYTILYIDDNVESHFKYLLLCGTYIHQNELPCYHDIYQASSDYRTWYFKCNLTWLQWSIYGLMFSKIYTYAVLFLTYSDSAVAHIIEIYFNRLGCTNISIIFLALWRTATGDAVLERLIENRCIKNSEGPATQHANLGTKQVVSLCSP